MCIVINKVSLLRNNPNCDKLKSELNTRFKTKEEAMAFLKHCQNAEFKIEDVTKRPGKKSPAAPFTTSTLQQEAAR